MACLRPDERRNCPIRGPSWKRDLMGKPGGFGCPTEQQRPAAVELGPRKALMGSDQRALMFLQQLAK